MTPTSSSPTPSPERPNYWAFGESTPLHSLIGERLLGKTSLQPAVPNPSTIEAPVPQYADLPDEEGEPTLRVPLAQEQATSREPWTRLHFRSASVEAPFMHADGKGDNDRVLDDSDYGIWGVFDGVGSMAGATDAAEITRKIVHGTLLAAAKPATLAEAKALMHQAFDAARATLRKMERDEDIEGSTTANVSFAVEIDGQDYLVIGNAGDSVCYKADGSGEPARLLTTEQSNAEYGQPNMIFNSISPYELWSEAKIAAFSRGHRVHADPTYYFDQIVIEPVKVGQRFIHVSDGIAGDYKDERLSVDEFTAGLHQADPAKMAGWLMAASRKEDDKSVVAVVVE